MTRFIVWFKHLSAPRILSLGFAIVILTGAILLWLPISHNTGFSIPFLDALFVSTSAVCVTGLTTIPIGYTLNLFGRFVLMILIQIGGWGVATAAVVFALFVGNKISLKSRQLLMDSLNFNGYTSIVFFIRSFIRISLVIEFIGAVLSFFCFIQDYPFWQAVGYSVFHSVSAFNNAGFDILGGYDSLLMYRDNVYMNLVTDGLVILGGFGFLAMMDMWKCRKSGWRKWALNTKIVFMMTLILLVAGTVLLKVTTDQTWLEASFQSVIARTAGFNTFPISDFSPAGTAIFCLLMFIGASPGSTGGGIKTTTFFALILKAVSSSMNEDNDTVFHRHVPRIVFEKASTVTVFAAAVCFTGIVLLLCFNTDISLSQALVEVISAFATVGSSTGITPDLVWQSKMVLIICMFIGRLGPVTIANLLVIKKMKDVHFTDEQFMIG